MDALEWFRSAVIVTLGLVVVSAIVYSYAQENPLFAWAMLGGGGVFAVIVAKAKGVFDNFDFSLSDLTDIFYR
jgi:hypothetical protein